MEDLQLVLFVLGAIAIIAVLVHGFWSIRKQQPRSIKESRPQAFVSTQRRDAEGFDADGIGEVRVRKVKPAEAPADTGEPEFALDAQAKVTKVRSRQEPVLGGNKAAAEAEMKRTEPEISQMELGLGSEQPQQENLFAETQELVEVEDAQVAISDGAAAQPQAEAKPEPEPEPELGEPRDVLVLHVVAREGQSLMGAELLPSLLTLNFKFGDMDIFHRHEDNAGTGKVLFSMANMLKPGTFDPDNMEQFTTQGVVLFMTLPCHGEALMNFSIMLNSAQQLADDLDALVLDGQRRPWDEHAKADYLRRIRAQA
ncbi:cell division protein ZipA [Shewanella sedimentimangrovi]|uniref:Cell division protein ZipA n=1 Tax=Shewanella sedimentimangrovi TaxID=2814293 RepID=A0ABX7QWK2_9GAMM|nr:cell division protein ZipA [Shewanella sedimentimangrovi]QSX35883.1 cell division protein ZipA [Shewanella sedimentimangrovi]